MRSRRAPATGVWRTWSGRAWPRFPSGAMGSRASLRTWPSSWPRTTRATLREQRLRSTAEPPARCSNPHDTPGLGSYHRSGETHRIIPACAEAAPAKVALGDVLGGAVHMRAVEVQDLLTVE